MQHSDAPVNELTKARAAIEAMLHATSLDEFEQAWKEYLGRIERIWYKASSHFGKSPKWKSWKRPHEKQREQDPLLAYLKAARGAEEHSVTEIVTQEQGRISVSAPPEGPWGPVGNIKLYSDGTLTYDGPPGAVKFNPARMVLATVTERGRSFPPPTRHAGQVIDPNEVIQLARLGADYYDTFLARAEDEFVVRRT